MRNSENLSNVQNREHVFSTGSLNISNYASKIDSYYSIHTPYLITYEYFSNDPQKNLFNCVMCSPEEVCFTTTSFSDYQKSTRKANLHHHDYYELMLVTEGSMTQKIEKNSYKYNAGSGCLLNKNVNHVEEIDSSCGLFFIGFSSEFILELSRLFKMNSSLSESRLMDSTIFRFMAEDASSFSKKYIDLFPKFQCYNSSFAYNRLYTTCNTILEISIRKPCGAIFIIKGLLCALLDFLSGENFHVISMELDAQEDLILFSRISHLFEDSYGRIPRQELENLLHYSSNYLNRITQKYVGMSLLEYETVFCMQKAAELLTSSEKTIAEIMEEMNFTNTTYFYKLFRKQYGTTPSQYRKNQKIKF